MTIYTLRKTQILPTTLKESWKFYSNPNNLNEITPPSLGLEITSETKNEIYEGMIITYKVNALPGIKIDWVTEITHIKEPNYFVDEQRFGPYKFWHHKHFLREVENGVEAEDLIHYSLPLGAIGNIINSLYVERNLENIFSYRKNFLEEKFG